MALSLASARPRAEVALIGPLRSPWPLEHLSAAASVPDANWRHAKKIGLSCVPAVIAEMALPF